MQASIRYYISCDYYLEEIYICIRKAEIEIEVLPANEGDCILITNEKEDIHILIDGGTAETYRNYLKTQFGFS